MSGTLYTLSHLNLTTTLESKEYPQLQLRKLRSRDVKQQPITGRTRNSNPNHALSSVICCFFLLLLILCQNRITKRWQKNVLDRCNPNPIPLKHQRKLYPKLLYRPFDSCPDNLFFYLAMLSRKIGSLNW